MNHGPRSSAYLIVLATLVEGLACSTDEPESANTNGGTGGVASDNTGGNNAGGRSGSTAETGDAGPAPVATTRTPLSVWEPNLPTEGQFCNFIVALECDGDEDCPGSQKCCGILNGGVALQYDAIRCEDECLLADGRRHMCHSDADCEDPDHSCIRSLIVPSYMRICGTEGTFTPTGFDGAPAVAGRVNCAPGLACADGEVCCSLSAWDAETQTTSFIDGRCAPTPEQCGCSTGTTEPLAVDAVDAGAEPSEPTSGDGGAGDAG